MKVIVVISAIVLSADTRERRFSARVFLVFFFFFSGPHDDEPSRPSRMSCSSHFFPGDFLSRRVFTRPGSSLSLHSHALFKLHLE